MKITIGTSQSSFIFSTHVLVFLQWSSLFLISAIHNAGLVTLTHTPSPMNFLERILERPSNERAFLLLPVGYPETAVTVPDLARKKLSEVSKFYK